MNLNALLLHTEHVHGREGLDFPSILADSFLDTLKILPLLFLAYLVIEVIEHKAANKLKNTLSHKHAGVLTGALLGLVPECGFSVAASNFYAEGLISAGTLVAVFVSTSDEALPIILSMPETAGYFLPLLAIKFLSAVAAGFLLDGILRFFSAKHAENEHLSHHHGHGEHIHEAGEHHHCSFCDSNLGVFKSTLKRTLMTGLFIFATVAVFNCIVGLVGEENIENFLCASAAFAPFITALVGLIPSCAVSVLLASLFAEGVISFGALAAGLCAGAGAGIAVLARSCKSAKKCLFIVGYTWIFSSLVGLLISLIA